MKASLENLARVSLELADCLDKANNKVNGDEEPHYRSVEIRERVAQTRHDDELFSLQVRSWLNHNVTLLDVIDTTLHHLVGETDPVSLTGYEELSHAKTKFVETYAAADLELEALGPRFNKVVVQ